MCRETWNKYEHHMKYIWTSYICAQRPGPLPPLWGPGTGPKIWTTSEIDMKYIYIYIYMKKCVIMLSNVYNIYMIFILYNVADLNALKKHFCSCSRLADEHLSEHLHEHPLRPHAATARRYHPRIPAKGVLKGVRKGVCKGSPRTVGPGFSQNHHHR